MGAHTALSRNIQPRHEKINAELLTPRQREILRLVSIGHTNREIADVLEISVRTVEVHRFNLRATVECEKRRATTPTSSATGTPRQDVRSQVGL